MILERQADGTYSITAPAETKAELKQEFTAEEVEKLISMRDEKKTANMEQSMTGIFDKVTNMEIMSIPIGEAVMGGALAIVIDRLVMTRIDPKNKYGMWVNLGMAFAIKKYGSKFLGGKTADAAALILTYEAVADFVTQTINKVLPPAAASKQNFAGQQSSAMHQFNNVANDYYAKAFGR